MADLAEKQDIEALEAAFEDKQRVMEESLTPAAPPSSHSEDRSTEAADAGAPEPDQEEKTQDNTAASSSKPPKRPRGWDQLTLLEKDVLVVLMAFCKVGFLQF